MLVGTKRSHLEFMNASGGQIQPITISLKLNKDTELYELDE